jgi:hypothetical protein
MKYVILPRDVLHEVMAGKRNTLPVTDPASPGGIIAAKTARNRRPTCLLHVTECELDPDGYTLTVRVHPHPHEPRLLAQDSTRGYTNDSRLALRHEPEAPPAQYVDELTVRNQARHDRGVRRRIERAREAREALADDVRLARLQAAAKANHVDVSPDVFVIKQMLKRGASVDHKLRQAEFRAYRETHRPGEG